MAFSKLHSRSDHRFCNRRAQWLRSFSNQPDHSGRAHKWRSDLLITLKERGQWGSNGICTGAIGLLNLQSWYSRLLRLVAVMLRGNRVRDILVPTGCWGYRCGVNGLPRDGELTTGL